MSKQQGSVGRRRLQLFLAALAFAGCGLGMALVVVFYGPPYNHIWWGVMAIVLGAAPLVAVLLAPAVEWVMAGYRQDGSG